MSALTVPDLDARALPAVQGLRRIDRGTPAWVPLSALAESVREVVCSPLVPPDVRVALVVALEGALEESTGLETKLAAGRGAGL